MQQRKETRQLFIADMENEILKNEYSRVRRETQIFLRQKKREYYNSILREAEEDFQQHKARQMYQNIKKATQPYKRKEVFVKDKDGNIITNEEMVAKRWAEYFTELLNAEDPPDLLQFNYPDTVDFDVPPPTLEEVQETITKLKNNKACGEDLIHSELIKYGGNELVYRVKHLLEIIWEQETMPDEWKTALITPIHKKNDPLNCNNYRGIALLNIAYKILSMILLKRILPLAEATIGEYQCGFRRGRSTVDQILVLRQLCEKAWEFNRDLHILFLDCIKAYDSVHRGTLLNILREFEFPKKLINLISMCIGETKAKIKTTSTTSELFTIESGLRQGDPISPVLFNLILEKIDREFTKQLEGGGFRIGDKILLRLAYADDIALIAETRRELENMVETFMKIAEKVGLKTSIEKSEYLSVTKNNDTDPLIVNTQTFKKVDNFKYLGTLINNKNEKDVEINARISGANRAFYSLQSVFKKRSLSKGFKIRLYRTNILPVLLYGCEGLTVRSVDENKFLVFERKVLRRIFGPVIDSRTGQWRSLKNRELEEKYRAPNIMQVFKARRMKYAGHVARMDENRTPLIMLTEDVEGKRSRGRPKLRWSDNIKADVEEMGLEAERWMEIAQDRRGWRESVEKTFGQLGPSHG